MPFDLSEATLVNAQRQQGKEYEKRCGIPSTAKESHCGWCCTSAAGVAAKAVSVVVEVSKVWREAHGAAGIVGSVELAFTVRLGAAILDGLAGYFLINML